MSDDQEGTGKYGWFAILGIGVTVVVLLVGAAVVQGFTFSALWGWFVVPLFAVPEIGIVQAIGLFTAFCDLEGWQSG